MSGICPPFWLDAPQILWTHAGEFFPFTNTDQECTASALNSFTRFGIYLGVLLTVLRMDIAWLLVGVAFAVFAAGAWIFMLQRGTTKDGFEDSPHPVVASTQPEGVREFRDEATELSERSDIGGKYLPDVIGSDSQRTAPTAANPFMNVLLTEIADNPYRAPAAGHQTTAVRNELDNYFQTMFASDPTDVFQRNQNQRQWVTQPSTTIPNDRKSFQEWLLLTPGQSCKEGNQEACTFFETGPQEMPWRSL